MELVDVLDLQSVSARATVYLYADLDGEGVQTGTSGNVQLAGDPVVEAVSNFDGIEKISAAVAEAGGAEGADLVVTPFDIRTDADTETAGVQAPADRILIINAPDAADLPDPADAPDPSTESQVTLPDLVDFPGTVVLGGTLVPPVLPEEGSERTPLPVVLPASLDTVDMENEYAGHEVYAERLVVAGSVGVLGSLVVTGNTVALAAGVNLAAGVPVTDTADARVLAPLEMAAGSMEEVMLLATGQSEVEDDSSGNIEAGGTIREPNVIYAGRGVLIADRAVTNSEALLLEFNNGELQFAVSQGFFNTSRPSILSQARGVNLSAAVSRFIELNGLGATGFLIVFVNPAGLLTGSIGVVVIDVSLFEEELTLFGTIGDGIAKSLSQCEEEEGCVPNISLQELDEVVMRLRTRITQLENQLLEVLLDSKSVKRQQELRGLLGSLIDQLDKFLQYREEYMEYYGESA